MILTVNDLSFSYNDAPVLQNVSFSMDEGEIICPVDPNGSGKTTLLDCVTGFLPVHKGEILICGKPLQTYRRQAQGCTRARPRGA